MSDIEYTPLEKRPLEPTQPDKGEITAPYGYTQAGTPRKRPARPGEGKPDELKPEYGEMLVKHCLDGKGLAEFCAEIGVSKPTLYGWAEKSAEFANCLARAKAAEQAWWEEQGRKGLADKTFNAHLWVKTMAARFKDDYTDKANVSGTIRLQLDKDDIAVC